MKKIAITGNIACGKSTVSKLVAEHFNISLINIDEYSKQWMHLNSMLVNDYANRAGCEVYDDVLDTVRKNIFKNSGFRRALEIAVEDSFVEYLDRLSFFHSHVIIEHPILFERVKVSLIQFDFIAGIFCEPNIQLDRMRKRGYTEEDISDRLDTQIPLKQNTRYCHLVIDTSHNPSSEDIINEFKQSERFKRLLEE